MIHVLPFSSFILVSVKIWTFAKFTIETAGFRKRLARLNFCQLHCRNTFRLLVHVLKNNSKSFVNPFSPEPLLAARADHVTCNACDVIRFNYSVKRAGRKAQETMYR